MGVVIGTCIKCPGALHTTIALELPQAAVTHYSRGRFEENKNVSPWRPGAENSRTTLVLKDHTARSPLLSSKEKAASIIFLAH
jgi:hypothetical protein